MPVPSQQWKQVLLQMWNLFYKAMTWMACLGLTVIGLYAIAVVPRLARDSAAAVSSNVIGNMRTCQAAVTSFAKDHNGDYPLNFNDITARCYFPDGCPPNKSGNPPINPVSNLHEWPLTGVIKDVDAARTTPSFVGKGVVEYSVIFDSYHRPISYAVRGGGKDGLPVKDLHGKVLILSNE